MLGVPTRSQFPTLSLSPNRFLRFRFPADLANQQLFSLCRRRCSIPCFSFYKLLYLILHCCLIHFYIQYALLILLYVFTSAFLNLLVSPLYVKVCLIIISYVFILSSQTEICFQNTHVSKENPNSFFYTKYISLNNSFHCSQTCFT